VPPPGEAPGLEPASSRRLAEAQQELVRAGDGRPQDQIGVAAEVRGRQGRHRGRVAAVRGALPACYRPQRSRRVCAAPPGWRADRPRRVADWTATRATADLHWQRRRFSAGMPRYEIPPTLKTPDSFSAPGGVWPLSTGLAPAEPTIQLLDRSERVGSRVRDASIGRAAGAQVETAAPNEGSALRPRRRRLARCPYARRTPCRQFCG
jgi:hypothetical protein